LNRHFPFHADSASIRAAALISALFLLPQLVFAQGPTVGTCPVLPADNIWNTRIDQLPVHPSSSTWVNTIGATTGVHADFGAGTWNGGPIGIPFITVPGAQTKYPATFLYQSESDTGPYAIPLNAPIEGGSASTGDRHAIAVDVDNCILYEIYRAFPQTASWQGDSGAIFNLKSDALRPATWTSADAAGLPIFPGLVRYGEIATGEIRHAIRFTVPQTQRAYVWPARHYASSLTGTQYPPMGARFRLRANFDLSSYSAVNQIILTAMKRYGIVLADNGSAWYISGAPDSRWNDSDLHALGNVKGSDFEAIDATTLMIDPNSGQAIQNGVTVSVSPSSSAVQINTTKQFTATVTNSTDQSVTWDINGVANGNSVVGWISATGLYTAPNIVPSPATVTIGAMSVSTPTAKGTASVTITNPPAPVSVSISPTSATIRVGRTKQFVATVQNSSNTSVTWKVNGITGGNATVGIISSSGAYRAPNSVPSPNTVTVTAVSVADPTKAAAAIVTILRH
jgi:hypothetical protein